MKKTVRLFLVIFLLSMLFILFPTIGFGNNSTYVETFEQLQTALSDPDTSEINLSSDIDIGGQKLEIRTDKTINLNGFSISALPSDEIPVFELHPDVYFTVNGGGSIIASRTLYSTAENSCVEINGGDGLTVSPSSDDYSHSFFEISHGISVFTGKIILQPSIFQGNAYTNLINVKSNLVLSNAELIAQYDFSDYDIKLPLPQKSKLFVVFGGAKVNIDSSTVSNEYGAVLTFDNTKLNSFASVVATKSDILAVTTKEEYYRGTTIEARISNVIEMTNMTDGTSAYHNTSFYNCNVKSNWNVFCGTYNAPISNGSIYLKDCFIENVRKKNSGFFFMDTQKTVIDGGIVYSTSNFEARDAYFNSYTFEAGVHFLEGTAFTANYFPFSMYTFEENCTLKRGPDCNGNLSEYVLLDADYTYTENDIQFSSDFDGYENFEFHAEPNDVNPNGGYYTVNGIETDIIPAMPQFIQNGLFGKYGSMGIYEKTYNSSSNKFLKFSYDNSKADTAEIPYIGFKIDESNGADTSYGAFSNKYLLVDFDISSESLYYTVPRIAFDFSYINGSGECVKISGDENIISLPYDTIISQYIWRHITIAVKYSYTENNDGTYDFSSSVLNIYLDGNLVCQTNAFEDLTSVTLGTSENGTQIFTLSEMKFFFNKKDCTNLCFDNYKVTKYNSSNSDLVEQIFKNPSKNLSEYYGLPFSDSYSYEYPNPVLNGNKVSDIISSLDNISDGSNLVVYTDTVISAINKDVVIFSNGYNVIYSSSTHKCIKVGNVLYFTEAAEEDKVNIHWSDFDGNTVAVTPHISGNCIIPIGTDLVPLSKTNGWYSLKATSFNLLDYEVLENGDLRIFPDMSTAIPVSNISGIKYSLGTYTNFIFYYYIPAQHDAVENLKIYSADKISEEYNFLNPDSLVHENLSFVKIDGREYYCIKVAEIGANNVDKCTITVTYEAEGIKLTQKLTRTISDYFDFIMESDGFNDIEKSLIMNCVRYVNEIYKLANGTDIGYDKYESLLNNQQYITYLTDISKYGEFTDILASDAQAVDYSPLTGYIKAAYFNIGDGFMPGFAFNISDSICSGGTLNGSLTIKYKNSLTDELISTDGIFDVYESNNTTAYRIFEDKAAVYNITSLRTIELSVEVDGSVKTVSGTYNLATYILELEKAGTDATFARALYAYALSSQLYKTTE